MDHNSEELEQARLVEQIFLYKDQIIELHDRHYRLSRRMHYTYKYFIPVICNWRRYLIILLAC